MNNLYEHDLSVDDIHDIRVETSKILDNMTNEEIVNYFKDAEKKFFKIDKKLEFA